MSEYLAAVPDQPKGERVVRAYEPKFDRWVRRTYDARGNLLEAQFLAEAPGASA